MNYSIWFALVAVVGVACAQNITIPFNFPLFKQVIFFSFAELLLCAELTYCCFLIAVSVTRSGLTI